MSYSLSKDDLIEITVLIPNWSFHGFSLHFLPVHLLLQDLPQWLHEVMYQFQGP